jgi:hypothetical protein
VVTPSPFPDPKDDQGWSFPDNEDGILSAIRQGATHLWANTILFSAHPLQTSLRLEEYKNKVWVVGQPPLLVEKFDDKEYTNNLLRSRGSFTMPRAWTVNQADDLKSLLASNKVPYPIVGKPIRGRGSHGVKVCHSDEEIYQHVQHLFRESPIVMLEEYLSGEEATVTVMPPSTEKPDYWAMPIVVRFDHQEGIAPYNGVVPVTANSKALTPQEAGNDVRYEEAARECELAARFLNVTAPIRVDIRRFDHDPKSKFALFDINMKPVSLSWIHTLAVTLRADVFSEHDWPRPSGSGESGQPDSIGLFCTGLELCHASSMHTWQCAYARRTPKGEARDFLRGDKMAKTTNSTHFLGYIQ